jgi:hypothetical protein
MGPSCFLHNPGHNRCVQTFLSPPLLYNNINTAGRGPVVSCSRRHMSQSAACRGHHSPRRDTVARLHLTFERILVASFVYLANKNWRMMSKRVWVRCQTSAPQISVLAHQKGRCFLPYGDVFATALPRTLYFLRTERVCLCSIVGD